jgi:hypothetical protein
MSEFKHMISAVHDAESIRKQAQYLLRKANNSRQFNPQERAAFFSQAEYLTKKANRMVATGLEKDVP